jgi:hypothetical protein
MNTWNWAPGRGENRQGALNRSEVSGNVVVRKPGGWNFGKRKPVYYTHKLVEWPSRVLARKAIV